MEPAKYRLGTINRESVIRPVDHRESVIRPVDYRNISPPRDHHKGKQTRKASIISMLDEGKTNDRISKLRLSLAPTTEQISDTFCNLKSNNDEHLSTFEEPPDEHEDESDEVVQHFTQMKFDEEQISQHLQIIEANESREVDNLIVKQSSNPSKEEEQEGMTLADKLARDQSFDIIGIMNLSSMHVTDQDIPTVIQRAFRGKRKKCFGLIFRDNALTSEGVKTLVDALLTIRTNLTYLSFADNPDIGDAGIEHLTRLLQNNRSINFLAITNTGMTDHGVRILADTLCGVGDHSSCAPLEKLYISFNKLITDASLEAILQIIVQNHTLKILSIRNCSFSNQARRRLRQVGAKMKKRKFSLAE